MTYCEGLESSDGPLLRRSIDLGVLYAIGDCLFSFITLLRVTFSRIDVSASLSDGSGTLLTMEANYNCLAPVGESPPFFIYILGTCDLNALPFGSAIAFSSLSRLGSLTSPSSESSWLRTCGYCIVPEAVILVRPEDIRAWLLLTLLCMMSGIIDRLELCTILARLYPMKLGCSVEFEFERGDFTEEMDGIIDFVIWGTCLFAF